MRCDYRAHSNFGNAGTPSLENMEEGGRTTCEASAHSPDSVGLYANPLAMPLLVLQQFDEALQTVQQGAGAGSWMTLKCPVHLTPR